MKIYPFKIPKPNNDALVYQEDIEKVFYDKLHQHEEIQLSYISAGTGTLLVGDSIHQYSEGDVIVIGSNLPHVFKSDNSSENSVMLSLFFNKDSFGKNFFDLDELSESRKFFIRAENGFLARSHKQLLHQFFMGLKESSRLERFISFLRIIHVLSNCKYKSLSTFVYDKQYSDTEGNRMRDVFEYTMSHLHKSISLKRISQIANMTPNAFCKYFKKRTNKSYFTFLNELRIAYACKLLDNHENESIADIAELSGFNNLSNFNRRFKQTKNMTPSEFRS